MVCQTKDIVFNLFLIFLISPHSGFKNFYTLNYTDSPFFGKIDEMLKLDKL